MGSKIKTREEWLEHNSYIAKSIFETADENLILIADGTYCFCQKSWNNTLQRKLYIRTTDGYILDIYGLFEATKNDATILTEILNSDEDLRDLLKPGDTLVGLKDLPETLV